VRPGRLPRRLLATTASRVALANALAFALAGVVVFAVLFAVSRGRILSQIDSDIEADRQMLLATYEDEGAAGLRETIQRRIEAARGGQDFYLLRMADGRVLAGNLPLMPVPSGWAWLQVPEGEGKFGLDDGALRADGLALPNGWMLLVGRNPRQLSDLENAFLGALVWTELGTLLFGLASGYLVSRRVLRGVQVIAEEAGRIGPGELSRRIPRLGGGGEIAQIGAAINLMLDRIGALTGSLRQVTNDIAHDLRTPLSRLRQKLERASLHAASEDELRAAIDRALTETDAVIGTFNALLRVAQVEARDRREGFAVVDLSELVIRLADAYGPSAEDAGDHMAVDVAPGVHVIGDQDLLGQMVANLIENALRHTPPGSRITLSLSKDPVGPRLVVADDGPGIPTHERERVLQRFVRLDASRATLGTGLGLALVKAVADLHGASLTLEGTAPGLRAVLAFPSGSARHRCCQTQVSEGDVPRRAHDD